MLEARSCQTDIVITNFALLIIRNIIYIQQVWSIKHHFQKFKKHNMLTCKQAKHRIRSLANLLCVWCGNNGQYLELDKSNVTYLEKSLDKVRSDTYSSSGTIEMFKCKWSDLSLWSWKLDSNWQTFLCPFPTFSRHSFQPKSVKNKLFLPSCSLFYEMGSHLVKLMAKYGNCLNRPEDTVQWYLDSCSELCFQQGWFEHSF